MKNLSLKSIAIQLQIIGSYMHIYLNLIPRFYLIQWKKCFTSTFACVVGTIMLIGAFSAIILFFIMIATNQFYHGSL